MFPLTRTPLTDAFVSVPAINPALVSPVLKAALPESSMFFNVNSLSMKRPTESRPAAENEIPEIL